MIHYGIQTTKLPVADFDVSITDMEQIWKTPRAAFKEGGKISV